MGRSTKSTQAFGQVKALLFLLILDFDQKYLKSFTMVDGDWCSYNSRNIHAWCIVLLPNLLIWPIEIWKREKMARLMIGVCSQWCRHLLLVATKGPRCRFTKIKSQMMPHPMPPRHPPTPSLDYRGRWGVAESRFHLDAGCLPVWVCGSQCQAKWPLSNTWKVSAAASTLAS